MNREIKFRAWDGKKMREVARVDFNNNLFGLMLKTPTESAPNHWCLRNLYDTPLMQYTGLKDKNGVEIYEGDIVRYDDYSQGGALTFKQPTRLGKVICNNLFHGISFYGLPATITESNRIEVIGNIYENPELLNK